MSTTVKIPQLLRELTGGADEVSVEAKTAGEALDGLEKKFPGVKGKICREDGSLRGFVNLYVNAEDVRFLDGLRTKLKEGNVLTILPMIAGG
jgi:molybdopterin synthase sulfur carrier subunit